MKYQFAVAAFAGSAVASLEAYGAAPPAYGEAPPAYGAEESSTSAAPTAPVYGAETTSTSAAPTAPVYGGETTTEASSTTAPAYPESTSSSASIPGYGGDHTVTDVVSTWVTYCPEPTSFTHEGKTYTVTAATTLTVCPKCEESTVSESKTKTHHSTSETETTVEATTAPSAPVYGAPSNTEPVENSPETGSSSAPTAPAYAPSSSAPSAPAYAPSSSAPSAPAYAPSSSAPSAPVYGAPSSTAIITHTKPAPYGYSNATIPAGPTGTGASASGTAPPAYTGAATQLVGGAAAGVAGLFAAFFL